MSVVTNVPFVRVAVLGALVVWGGVACHVEKRRDRSLDIGAQTADEQHGPHGMVEAAERGVIPKSAVMPCCENSFVLCTASLAIKSSSKGSVISTCPYNSSLDCIGSQLSLNIIKTRFCWACAASACKFTCLKYPCRECNKGCPHSPVQQQRRPFPFCEPLT